MLNTNVDEFVWKDGKISGIKATMTDPIDKSEMLKFETKCSMILADPTYFPDKARPTRYLLRAICILNSPIPALRSDKKCNEDKNFSLQLIIPQSQIGRKNDVYVAALSPQQKVCPDGYYIATVSTISEGGSDYADELKSGLDQVGTPVVTFMVPPVPVYEPLESGHQDKVFLSKSYDSTSHFESTTDDIQDIYFRATGEPLVVKGLREGQLSVTGN